MRILILCLLVGACSSAPRRSGDSGPDDPTPDAGGTPVTPGVDAAGAPPFVDPPPGTPAAKLMGFPLDLDFGTVAMGAAPRSNAITITNIGDAPSRPLEATLNSAPDLRLTSNCKGRQLRPGETCVVTAEFEPRSIGMSMASGSVDDGAGGAAPVAFMARGVGRLAPDAGPDVARPIPMGDAGPDVPRDTAAAVDLARDVGVDAVVVPRDVAPDVTAAADARD
jgi:hypothetical protein